MGLLIMKYFSVIGDDFIIRIWPHNMSRAGRRSCHSLAAEHGTGEFGRIICPGLAGDHVIRWPLNMAQVAVSDGNLQL